MSEKLPDQVTETWALYQKRADQRANEEMQMRQHHERTWEKLVASEVRAHDSGIAANQKMTEAWQSIAASLSELVKLAKK